MSDIKKHTEVTSCKTLASFIEGKEKNHTHYYHYSSIDAIDNILKEKAIRVSSMTTSNDITEHRCFGADTYTKFQLCFSTGTTENLPLWFLYAGVNGTGARIDFPKSTIQDFMNPTNMHLSLCDSSTNELITDLKIGKNCRIQFLDVIYREKEGCAYRVKYNNRMFTKLPATEFGNYEQSHRGFIKDIIWFYEKETRLIVDVRPDLLDRSLFFDAMETAPYYLRLSIPDDVYQKISITLSPQYTNESTETAVALAKEGICRLVTEKSLSKYAGKIKINLCKNCNPQSKE